MVGDWVRTIGGRVRTVEGQVGTVEGRVRRLGVGLDGSTEGQLYIDRHGPLLGFYKIFVHLNAFAKEPIIRLLPPSPPTHVLPALLQ